MCEDYNITPVPKPRMTQADRWKKRPCTQRYWDFKDKVRELGVVLPERGFHAIFYIPMPKSWSKKKKLEMRGQPHKEKKDIDNLLKALLDAVYDDDAHIWDCRVTKLWWDKGKISISELSNEVQSQ